MITCLLKQIDFIIIIKPIIFPLKVFIIPVVIRLSEPYVRTLIINILASCQVINLLMQWDQEQLVIDSIPRLVLIVQVIFLM